MITNHTRGPYRVEGVGIRHADGLFALCDFDGCASEIGAERAAHIVSCVNAHDELVAALIEAAAALATVANNIRREDNGETPVLASIAYFTDDAVAKARSALARVKGEA